MEFSILQDNKNLFAKCKLLGDYKPITTLVSGTRVRFSIGSILPSVDGDVGADMVFI